MVLQIPIFLWFISGFIALNCLKKNIVSLVKDFS